MIANPQALIEDFIHVAKLAGLTIGKADLTHNNLPAPHTPRPLPNGKQAVYVFSLPVPSSLVLKVGKVRTNSNARFQFQHYNPQSAKSNLAKSLLLAEDRWGQIGVLALNESNVGEWLKTNVDRDHFFIGAEHDHYSLDLLEIFLQCRLRPIFENRILASTAGVHP